MTLHTTNTYAFLATTFDLDKYLERRNLISSLCTVNDH